MPSRRVTFLKNFSRNLKESAKTVFIEDNIKGKHLVAPLKRYTQMKSNI